MDGTSVRGIRNGRYEIIGVVADAKYLNLYETPPRMVYMNAFQEGRGTDRTSRCEPMSTRQRLSTTCGAWSVRCVPNVGVRRVTTLTEQIDASIVVERLVALLSGAFGVVGALLAAIGLYGLLAYTVSRRTSEIGVRMALGATQESDHVMVLKSALGLVLAGLAIGIPLAAMGPRVLAQLAQS